MTMDVANERKATVKRLYESGVIRRREVLEAMMKVPRERFLPPSQRRYAHIDMPIPIGYGQTTSALHMTAMLCEYAELALGKIVLEIGCGSGYMAAVYAEIVNPAGKGGGHVYTVEIIPELAFYAQRNLRENGYSDRVDVLVADGSSDPPIKRSFDAIIVTAAAPPEVAEILAERLSYGGVLVIPVGSPYGYQELWIVKRGDGLARRTVSLVSFVPLRGIRGWDDT